MERSPTRRALCQMAPYDGHVVSMHRIDYACLHLPLRFPTSRVSVWQMETLVLMGMCTRLLFRARDLSSGRVACRIATAAM